MTASKQNERNYNENKINTSNKEKKTNTHKTESMFSKVATVRK